MSRVGPRTYRSISSASFYPRTSARPRARQDHCSLGERKRVKSDGCGRLVAHYSSAPFGVIHEPATLADKVFVDFMQRMPQLTGWRACRAVAALTPEDMHAFPDPLDRDLGVVRVPFQIRQRSRSTCSIMNAFVSIR